MGAVRPVSWLSSRRARVSVLRVVGTVLIASMGAVLSGLSPSSALATPMPTASVPATASVTASARASAAPKPPLPTFAPDPTPTEAREQWRYTINVRDGELFVGSPTKVDRGKVVATPRSLGRFAIELYVGESLLERVRFDIPMLHDDPDAGPKATRFDRKANGKVYVEVPNLDRATYAMLIDRSTGSRRRVPWPPVDGIPKVSIPTGADVYRVGYPRGLCAPEPVR